jgi:hypothetical protein
MLTEPKVLEGHIDLIEVEIQVSASKFTLWGLEVRRSLLQRLYLGVAKYIPPYRLSN